MTTINIQITTTITINNQMTTTNIVVEKRTIDNSWIRPIRQAITVMFVAVTGACKIYGVFVAVCFLKDTCNNKN